MTGFVSFISKYADEALSVGKALSTLLEGLALSPKQSQTVNDVITKLEAAHDNITKAVATNKVATVKIDKKDIETAVAKVLPKLLEDQVSKAVIAALANEKAKDQANEKS